MAILYTPQANQTIVCSSGNSYGSDENHIVVNVSNTTDIQDLIGAGCIVLGANQPNLLFTKIGANFNSTGDQILTPVAQGKFRITKIVVVNTSVNGMPTAAGGFYTGAGKTGTTIVSAGQVYTGLTNALTALELTLAIAASLVFVSGTSIYLSLSTPKGGAATADIYVFGEIYD